MKKVAVIGAGIVGSTAAYYLSKSPDVEVTVFDDGKGQATKAAAGIISPWFSKRRNKAWYRMARLGADFYQDLIAELKAAGIQTDFYQQTGVYLLKKDDSKLQELYDLAANRREEAPLIGGLGLLSRQEAQKKFSGSEVREIFWRSALDDEVMALVRQRKYDEAEARVKDAIARFRPQS